MPKFQVSSDSLERLRLQFEQFDRDGNGEIDTRELMTLCRAIGQNPSMAEVEEMIHEADEDGSGTIVFEEFVLLMQRYGKTEEEVEKQLRTAFQVLDQNKDGFVSAEELKRVLTSLGERMTEEEVADLLHDADFDRNGLIDYEEFIRMMTSLSAR